jgi:hypothetical protein
VINILEGSLLSLKELARISTRLQDVSDPFKGVLELFVAANFHPCLILTSN